MDLARASLKRAEEAADQLDAGSRAVNALPRGFACTPAGLEMLRRIDLSSTLLQAVGHLDGTTIDCSSHADRTPIPLGPPDIVTALGVFNWINFKPYRGDLTYIAVGSGSFVGIVHKDLLLSYTDEVDGLGLSTFNWSHRRPLLSRGTIDPRWIANIPADTVRRIDGHLIAVARSRRYDLGAIAALPLRHEEESARELAMVLVPLGILAGLLLSTILVRALRSHMSMPQMIRSALRGGEFHLLYQPAIELATGRMVGAEALIRWRRPDGEMIPPDHFIAVAEQAGVIRLITARVMELLAADARSALRLDPDFHFGINFSAADMLHPGLVDQIATFIRRAGMSPRNLVIEATERSFLDLQATNVALKQLRALEVKVAIDDFGTGYSSLGYLAHLDIDILKIDKVFVQALGTSSATNQVASRIIDMAKDLNLIIIAEGIETDEQASRLRELGVEFAQGFYFGRPMPMDLLLQRLRAERKRPAGTPTLTAQAA